MIRDEMNERNLDNIEWSQKSDDELVVTNLEQAPKELTRRLKDSLLQQHASTTALNQKLLNLNIQLRNFTVGLYFIGGVQLLLFIYQLFLNS